MDLGIGEEAREDMSELKLVKPGGWWVGVGREGFIRLAGRRSEQLQLLRFQCWRQQQRPVGLHGCALAHCESLHGMPGGPRHPARGFRV
jgi:hypothetical protein